MAKKKSAKSKAPAATGKGKVPSTVTLTIRGFVDSAPGITASGVIEKLKELEAAGKLNGEKLKTDGKSLYQQVANVMSQWRSKRAKLGNASNNGSGQRKTTKRPRAETVRVASGNEVRNGLVGENYRTILALVDLVNATSLADVEAALAVVKRIKG